MNKTKAAPMADTRVQALQVMDISDYEKLFGLVEGGESLPEMLRHKASGPYVEPDFAAWLHSPGAPSDKPRLSILERRWQEMTDRLILENDGAGEADVTEFRSETPANDIGA
jgi:hypothetical protein